MNDNQIRIHTEGYERLRPEEMDPLGVQNLVEAIVKTAADDWRKAVKKGKKMMGTRMECERFFKSKWFEQLTGCNGEYILEQLKREAWP